MPGQYVVVVVTAGTKGVETEIFGPFPVKPKATTYAKLRRAKQDVAVGLSASSTAAYVSRLLQPH